MLQFAVTPMLSFVFGIGPSSTYETKESYRWAKVAEAGSGCFAPKCRDGQFPMAIKPITGFDGKLFLIGDKCLMERSGWWAASIGTTRGRPLTAKNGYASFPLLRGQSEAQNTVVFNEKLWLFSGKTGREDSWDGAIWAMSRGFE